ncbi:MAG TPA: hypothetical protein VEH77_16640 [Roseiarcus sp.]|nr:hypothetical protein [Roseiarcus sp.]
MTSLTNYHRSGRYSRDPNDVERGEEVIIANNSVPKARPTVIPKPTRKRQPSKLPNITYAAGDFDETDERIIRDSEGSD